MTHFTVLVVGKNVEKQLAPFQEFECTGLNDKYVQEIDVTEEVENVWKESNERLVKDGEQPESFRQYLLRDEVLGVDSVIGRVILGLDSVIDRDGAQKYGYTIHDESKPNGLRVVNRTNPNHRWDWWVVGGRWGDFFLLKSGGRADEARKSEINFDGMRDEAAKKALVRFDRFRRVIGDSRLPDWDAIREQHKGDLEAARAQYQATEVCQKLAKLSHSERRELEGMFESLSERYCNMDRDRYEARARAGAFRTCALVRNAEWFEKGKMGWFGTCSDEMPEEEWTKKFEELLASVPDDEMLTLVDCHT